MIGLRSSPGPRLKATNRMIHRASRRPITCMTQGVLDLGAIATNNQAVATNATAIIVVETSHNAIRASLGGHASARGKIQHAIPMSSAAHNR